jgi:SAM-dependent methyltransferase
MSEIPDDWYEGFFEGVWLDHLALGPSQGWTEKQVAFLVDRLELGDGTRVLDAPCGRGRVAIPLAAHGCRVTGLDFSPRSLELARRDAETAGVELELIERDIRQLDEVERFDVALNLYSSFGYFADQADDERVLAATARALVPGGVLVIDTINPIAMAAQFRETDWRELEGGVLFLETRGWDYLRGRTEATWTLAGPDGARSELRFSIRAYTAPEMVAMLDRAGLRVETAWGGWDGQELGDGVRQMLLARKTA